MGKTIVSKIVLNQRDAFIRHLWDQIVYVDTQYHLNPTEQLELLAQCILVTIDGENANIGPFALRPIDEKGKEGEDIAIGLHDNFYPVKKFFLVKKRPKTADPNGHSDQSIEQRDQFLRHVWQMVDQVNACDKSPRRKLELFVFCFLACLDGEDAFICPFSLRPIDEQGDEGDNIAIDLHDTFYVFKPKHNGKKTEGGEINN